MEGTPGRQEAVNAAHRKISEAHYLLPTVSMKSNLICTFGLALLCELEYCAREVECNEL